MIYFSTRNKNIQVSSAKAIIDGIAKDGGLYVPSLFPQIDLSKNNIIHMNYKELAYFVMEKFLTDYTSLELHNCIEAAYDSKFTTQAIAPLKEVYGVHFLELYHGPTLAFKDMALSILPHLLKTATLKEGIKKKVVILTATSGDTGKAALEGFANIENTIVIVFYPKDGVSEIQKQQMITQEGNNTYVIGINGNFDDAQRGVKEIFNDLEFIKTLEERNYILSSANSINIGRLIPQITYYFHGYLTLLRDKKIIENEFINVVVPTGNFGNVLAAYYAKRMGLPINKLICASNDNNVITDFLKTGKYDSNRELKLTNSPSMDILISSNLERLLFELSEQDDTLIDDLMKKLVQEGKYEVPNKIKNSLDMFYGNYASETESEKELRELYKSSHYIMDTHTAVAYSVYQKYRLETLDETCTIIVSTASPFKFGRSVCKAIDIETFCLDDFEVNTKLSESTGNKIPTNLSQLKSKKILHIKNCEKTQMKNAIEEILM